MFRNQSSWRSQLTTEFWQLSAPVLLRKAATMIKMKALEWLVNNKSFNSWLIVWVPPCDISAFFVHQNLLIFHLISELFYKTNFIFISLHNANHAFRFIRRWPSFICSNIKLVVRRLDGFFRVILSCIH